MKQVLLPIWAWVLLGSLVALVIIGLWMNWHAASVKYNTILGALATLGIFSILYKENPVFRLCEHLFIGLATGYGAVVVWYSYILPKWLIPMAPPTMIHESVDHVAGGGQWWLIFALLLALLFYTVYFQKLAWMNRFILSILMGYAAGAMFEGFMGLIGPQLTSSFRPPVTVRYAPPSAGHLNNFHWGSVFFHPWWSILVIVLICTFAYFFFSVEHRSHLIREPARAGRYFLMISLGAIFGTTVMGRLSLLIARLDFLRDAFVMFFHIGAK